MKINRVGVDLAKNVFQLHGVDCKGKALWNRRLTRGKWLAVGEISRLVAMVNKNQSRLVRAWSYKAD